MSSHRRVLRKSLTFAALAMFLSGCGPTGFNVGMERLISNVVFGMFQPKPQPSPQELPPLQAPSIPLPASIDFGSNLPADNSPCPEAPPGTPADKAATTNVDSAATNGMYKWYSSYNRSVSGPGGGGSATSGFETREVIDAHYVGQDASSVGGQPDYVYQWTEVKPDPWQTGYVDELTYQARTYSNLDNPPATFILSATYSGNYDPDAGIDLIDLKRFKGTGRSGTLAEEFAPTQASHTVNGQVFSGTPGLLIFTLPVPGTSAGLPVVGGQPPSPVPNPTSNGTNQFGWQAQASDPTHQWTEQINAFEGNQRVVVDACGAVVDGWPVTATLTISKNDPATGTPYTSPLTITWKYIVAPQYGGIIVSESFDGDSGYGSTVKTQEVLGSLQIAPLPKGS
jgi:hypothetical protein